MGVGDLDLGIAKYSRYKVFDFLEGSKKVRRRDEGIIPSPKI